MIAKLSGKFEGRARIPPMHSLESTVLLPIFEHFNKRTHFELELRRPGQQD